MAVKTTVSKTTTTAPKAPTVASVATPSMAKSTPTPAPAPAPKAPATTTNVAKYGNDGVGYDPVTFQQDMNNFASNPIAYQQELARVNDVIANRQSAGMDISKQTNYLSQLQAVAPSPSPSMPSQSAPSFQQVPMMQMPMFEQPMMQQPSFDMGQFQSMFDGMQNQSNQRIQALERMLEQQSSDYNKKLEELMNKFKYRDAQINPNAFMGGEGGMPSIHNPLTDAMSEGLANGSGNEKGVEIGFRQEPSMNSALLRYMQNLWGGGF